MAHILIRLSSIQTEISYFDRGMQTEDYFDGFLIIVKNAENVNQ